MALSHAKSGGEQEVRVSCDPTAAKPARFAHLFGSRSLHQSGESVTGTEVQISFLPLRGMGCG